MPGPVSDSYDPEWGTSDNVARIGEALGAMHAKVSHVLGNKPPIYILHLVDKELPTKISAELTERDWRLIRFALERARESL